MLDYKETEGEIERENLLLEIKKKVYEKRDKDIWKKGMKEIKAQKNAKIHFSLVDLTRLRYTYMYHVRIRNTETAHRACRENAEIHVCIKYDTLCT